MEIIYLAGILIWLLVAYKWGSWSGFNQYHSTIYIMIIGDLLCRALTDGSHLWFLESPTLHLRPAIVGIIITFITFPCTYTVFLLHYPEKGYLKQALYNLAWISVYSFHEWIALTLGVFSYTLGWNLGWSIFLNVIAFPFARLHQKRPNIAMVVFIIWTVYFSVMFKIPLFERP